MPVQGDKQKVYQQKKNPLIAERAGQIFRVKLVLIAVLGIIGIIRLRGDIASCDDGNRALIIAPDVIWTLFGRGKIGDWLAGIIAELGEVMIKPYVGFPLLLACFVLTLQWEKAQWLIVVHGILYVLLGFQFYMAWYPLIGERWVWFFIILWPLSIILFICAWNGNRMIKLKEVEGMDSIFPEKRSSGGGNSNSEEH